MFRYCGLRVICRPDGTRYSCLLTYLWCLTTYWKYSQQQILQAIVFGLVTSWRVCVYIIVFLKNSSVPWGNSAKFPRHEFVVEWLTLPLRVECDQDLFLFQKVGYSDEKFCLLLHSPSRHALRYKLNLATESVFHTFLSQYSQLFSQLTPYNQIIQIIILKVNVTVLLRNWV